MQEGATPFQEGSESQEKIQDQAKAFDSLVDSIQPTSLELSESEQIQLKQGLDRLKKLASHLDDKLFEKFKVTTETEIGSINARSFSTPEKALDAYHLAFMSAYKEIIQDETRQELDHLSTSFEDVITAGEEEAGIRAVESKIQTITTEAWDNAPQDKMPHPLYYYEWLVEIDKQAGQFTDNIEGLENHEWPSYEEFSLTLADKKDLYVSEKLDSSELPNPIKADKAPIPKTESQTPEQAAEAAELKRVKDIVYATNAAGERLAPGVIVKDGFVIYEARDAQGVPSARIASSEIKSKTGLREWVKKVDKDAIENGHVDPIEELVQLASDGKWVAALLFLLAHSGKIMDGGLGGLFGGDKKEKASKTPNFADLSTLLNERYGIVENSNETWNGVKDISMHHLALYEKEGDLPDNPEEKNKIEAFKDSLGDKWATFKKDVLETKRSVRGKARPGSHFATQPRIKMTISTYLTKNKDDWPNK